MDVGEPTSTFFKADWARCAEASVKYLAEAGETRTDELAEETYMNAMNKASGLFIPSGHIRHYHPTLPASIADERDRKRRLIRADQIPSTKRSAI